MTSLSGHPAAGNSMQLSAFSQGQNLTKVLRRNILKDLQKNVVSMCVSRSFPYFSWVKKTPKLLATSATPSFQIAFQLHDNRLGLHSFQGCCLSLLQQSSLGCPRNHGFLLEGERKTVRLAQLCNPTAKGSSKVPGLSWIFGACIFVSPVPGPRDWNPTDSLLGITGISPLEIWVDICVMDYITMDPTWDAPPTTSHDPRFSPNMPRVGAWSHQEAWKLKQLKSMTHPRRQEYLHLSIYLSIYLSIHPSIHPSIYLSIYIFIYTYIYIYANMYICKYVYIYIYIWYTYIYIYIYANIYIWGHTYIYTYIWRYISIYFH